MLLLLSLGVLAAPVVALAQEAPVAQPAPAPTDAGIRVKLVTLHATTAPGQGNAPKRLATRLAQSFPGYKTFNLLETTVLELGADKSGGAALPDGKKLVVTYLGRAGEKVKLRLAIPPLLKTDYQIANGGVLYQATAEYKGGILLLAIQAGSPDKVPLPKAPAKP